MSDLYLYQDSPNFYTLNAGALIINFDHFEQSKKTQTTSLFRGNEFIGMVRRKHYTQFCKQMAELQGAQS